ncbi:MAG TPA: hypothetical protein VKB93_12005 [Thermoanaerobaculia bacterium]|nr:hypothetical protein [Thermoanaerobaculia bacterium]
MSYWLVFACGVFVGRNWKTLRGAVAPVVVGASQRFDALYADAARSVARTLEDVEDRALERRHRAELTN